MVFDENLFGKVFGLGLRVATVPLYFYLLGRIYGFNCYDAIFVDFLFCIVWSFKNDVSCFEMTSAGKVG